MAKIIHSAPAGQKYNSIREAGEQTLAIYCDKLPENTNGESFILPVLFETNHHENINICAGLSAVEQRGFKGLQVNIHGERGEYEVYKAFYHLVRQSPTESSLGLFGYNLDNDNGKNLKLYAIINELPFIDLTGVNTRREHDAILIVGNTGVVLCEAKNSASAENLLKGEEQLNSFERFVKQVFAAICGANPHDNPSRKSSIPTIKVIIVPNEQSEPSFSPMFNQCHVIYGDELSNFSTKWLEVVNEMKRFGMNQSIIPAHFEHFIQFVVGIWTMKPIKKTSYDFENIDACLEAKIASVDAAINQQQYAPTKQAQVFTTDIATSMNDVFHRDFNILYLNPAQKSLFDHHSHAVIHSHAGAGKSILIMCKIIELLESDPTQKVILVAPNPHHFRCQMILKRHNISTEIVMKFPFTKSAQPLLPSCNVLIITTKDFFHVTPSELMLYEMSSFNLFFDDLHAHKVQEDSNICTFTDIGNFIDTTYTTRNTTNQYLWVAFDIVQGEYRGDDKCRPDHLFVQSDGNTRNFQMPVITMTAILRNTQEVSDVVVTARNEQSRALRLSTSHVIQDICCGHHITTGDRVLYEKLQPGTYDEHEEPFLCDRVSALLQKLTKTSPNSFPFGAVAVLFDTRKYLPALRRMLRTNFNIGTQTIEHQILSNNNNDILVDDCRSIQSFECATVVVVRTRAGGIGGRDVICNLISRARTKCVVVDVAVDEPPLPLRHVDVVVWEEKHGSFTKV